MHLERLSCERQWSGLDVAQRLVNVSDVDVDVDDDDADAALERR